MPIIPQDDKSSTPSLTSLQRALVKDILSNPPERPYKPTANHQRFRRLATRDGGYSCHYCKSPLIAIGGEEGYSLHSALSVNKGMIYFVANKDGKVEQLPFGVSDPTIDHKIPKTKGGTSDFSNLVLSCRSCNAQKGAKYTYEEFVAKKSGVRFHEPDLPTEGVKAVLDLLASERIIAYRPYFAHIFGGAACAVLLSQFWFWTNSDTVKTREIAWFWKSQTEITAETGLTRYETETARRKLISLGAMEEELRGTPATLHYWLNKDRIYSKLWAYIKGNPDKFVEILNTAYGTNNQFAGIPQTRSRGSRKQVCEYTPHKVAITPHTITDTTPKKTKENSQRVLPPAAAGALSEVKTSFSFQEQKEPKPTPMPYDMAGEKREQFQAMAAAEIGKALEGTGLKANYRAIDSRGRTLYEQACREAAAKEGN